jgi:hypothetical protein
MSPAISRLFHQPPRTRRGPDHRGTPPDPFFADPAVVEDDYLRLRRPCEP